MKRILLFSLMLVSVAVGQLLWEKDTTILSKGDFHAVQFEDSRFFFSGSGEFLGISIDGKKLSLVKTPGIAGLARFVLTTEGLYALDNKGTLFISTNHGVNWKRDSSAMEEHFLSIDGAGSRIMGAVSSGEVISKTTRTAKWSRQKIFRDSTAQIAVSKSGAMLKLDRSVLASTDFETWKPVDYTRRADEKNYGWIFNPPWIKSDGNRFWTPISEPSSDPLLMMHPRKSLLLYESLPIIFADSLALMFHPKSGIVPSSNSRVTRDGIHWTNFRSSLFPPIQMISAAAGNGVILVVGIHREQRNREIALYRSELVVPGKPSVGGSVTIRNSILKYSYLGRFRFDSSVTALQADAVCRDARYAIAGRDSTRGAAFDTITQFACRKVSPLCTFTILKRSSENWQVYNSLVKYWSWYEINKNAVEKVLNLKSWSPLMKKPEPDETAVEIRGGEVCDTLALYYVGEHPSHDPSFQPRYDASSYGRLRIMPNQNNSRISLSSSNCYLLLTSGMLHEAGFAPDGSGMKDFRLIPSRKDGSSISLLDSTLYSYSGFEFSQIKYNAETDSAYNDEMKRFLTLLLAGELITKEADSFLHASPNLPLNQIPKPLQEMLTGMYER